MNVLYTLSLCNTAGAALELTLHLQEVHIVVCSQSHPLFHLQRLPHSHQLLFRRWSFRIYILLQRFPLLPWASLPRRGEFVFLRRFWQANCPFCGDSGYFFSFQGCLECILLSLNDLILLPQVVQLFLQVNHCVLCSEQFLILCVYLSSLYIHFLSHKGVFISC